MSVAPETGISVEELRLAARNHAMLLDVNSAPGATMTPAQVALYDALFTRDIAGPLGLAK